MILEIESSLSWVSEKKVIDTFHQPLTHSLEIASDALVEQILRVERLTFRMTGIDTKKKDVQRIKLTDNDANLFRTCVIFTIRRLKNRYKIFSFYQI